MNWPGPTGAITNQKSIVPFSTPKQIERKQNIFDGYRVVVLNISS
jgi:hypothetical protein